jgi:hypothetical protein
LKPDDRVIVSGGDRAVPGRKVVTTDTTIPPLPPSDTAAK